MTKVVNSLYLFCTLEIKYVYIKVNEFLTNCDNLYFYGVLITFLSITKKKKEKKKS